MSNHTAGYTAAAGVVAGIVWVTTGRDPLYWTALALLALRAALIQFGQSGALAVVHFKTEFPARLVNVRDEVEP